MAGSTLGFAAESLLDSDWQFPKGIREGGEIINIFAFFNERAKP
jgi:hypothetical protein